MVSMSGTPVLGRLGEEDPHEFKASLSYTGPVSNRQSFTACFTHSTKQVPHLRIETKREPCLREIVVLLCFLCVCRSKVACSFFAFRLIL